MKDCVNVSIRTCYYCQSKKTAWSTVRWPIVSLALPSRPGRMVGVDLSGPLPRTVKAKSYILLIADESGRQAEAYALIVEGKTAEGCASSLVNNYR